MVELKKTSSEQTPDPTARRVTNRQRDRRRPDSNIDATGTAAYLLERRALLDRTLREEGDSAMSRIMRRCPPIPVALVMIGSQTTRERFLKLLRNANIEVEPVSSVAEALASLQERVHSLLFTDQVDLIRQARQLHAGAATHIVFISGASESRSALRAGANDCMPEEARGEQFWARLTTARRIASLAASLQLALFDNRVLSTIDELTRCASRRFFEQEFPREVERAARLGRPLALLMCDIDHFKLINDSHGHQVGDEVLREFADRLDEGLRHGTDWVARVGGEEFALVLPEASLAESEAIARRLRERIRAIPFETSSAQLRVTASFGLCSLNRVRPDSRVHHEMLIKTADGALYESKRSGRDRLTARVFPDTAPGGRLGAPPDGDASSQVLSSSALRRPTPSDHR
jgi:two-component system cell cycle response regulator